jgi:hypothetical protein
MPNTPSHPGRLEVYLPCLNPACTSLHLHTRRNDGGRDPARAKQLGNPLSVAVQTCGGPVCDRQLDARVFGIGQDGVQYLQVTPPPRMSITCCAR